MSPEVSAANVELALSLADEDGRDRDELLSLAPGFHPDVRAEVYHQRVEGIASKSALDLIARSPAHYRAWLDGYSRKETPALSLGKAIHMALLEPALFERTYLIEPAWGDLRATEGRTTKEQGKANKERRDAWRKEHAGAVILDSKEGATALGMVRAVAAHPLAQQLLEGARPEVTMIWEDPETGLRCKARVDGDNEELETFLDVKSCLDARPEAFARSLASLGYHDQDAMYREGAGVLGRRIRNFVFVCVEKEPPHAVGIHTIDAVALELGARRMRKNLLTLARHTAFGDWPAYPETINVVSLPKWALNLEGLSP